MNDAKFNMADATTAPLTEASGFEIVTRGGVKLAAERTGDPAGPTVLLLHGGGQTRRSWGTALSALGRAGYNAIAYDARGHGESAWSPDGLYGFERLAEDLEDVAAAVDGPVALVGASMGGMTAFRVAGEGRVAVTALVLVDIVPRPARRGGERIVRFMTANQDGFATVEEAADAVTAYYPERARPKDISGLNRNLRRRGDGRLYWHWDPRLFGGDTATPPDFAEWALRLAPQITAPVLLVRGDRSDVVDDEGVAELTSVLPQTEVLRVQGAGHMIAGDQNDAFNDGVLAFVRQHAPVDRRTA